MHLQLLVGLALVPVESGIEFFLVNVVLKELWRQIGEDQW